MAGMKLLALPLSALMLVAAAPAPQQNFVDMPRNSEAPASCPLTVQFGSYGTGIDRPTLKRVEDLLRRERRVAKVERYRWGREGEVTLCARTRSASDARRLFARIKPMLPRGRGKPQITLALRNGARVEAGRP